MRILLFGFSFFMTNCFGQPNPNQQLQIDTAKLFNPKSLADNSVIDTSMFQHCVIIQPDLFEISFSGLQLKVNNITEFKKIVTANSSGISQRTFYIFCDSNTPFKKIMEVIDVVESTKINNYRVINIQSYFKPHEPIVMQTPTVVTEPVDRFDSTYLNIEITDNQYYVSLLNKSLIFKSIKQLDKFILVNKNLIEKQKILLKTKSKTHYDRVKPVIKILTQHNFFEFQLLTM